MNDWHIESESDMWPYLYRVPTKRRTGKVNRDALAGLIACGICAALSVWGVVALVRHLSWH